MTSRFCRWIPDCLIQIFLVETQSLPSLLRCYLAALPSISEIPLNSVASPLSRRYLAVLPSMSRVRALHSSIETRSAPGLARCYPRSFTFYLGDPISRFLGSWLPD